MNFLELTDKITDMFKTKAVLPTIVLGLTFTMGIVFSPYFTDYQASIASHDEFAALNYTVQDNTMYNILRQGEKFNGDSFDIKKADMFNLSQRCIEPAFVEHLEEAPYRLKVQTKALCDRILNKAADTSEG